MDHWLRALPNDHHYWIKPRKPLPLRRCYVTGSWTLVSRLTVTRDMAKRVARPIIQPWTMLAAVYRTLPSCTLSMIKPVSRTSSPRLERPSSRNSRRQPQLLRQWLLSLANRHCRTLHTNWCYHFLLPCSLLILYAISPFTTQSQY